jgi:tRNA 2-selenouridine synthase SelU
VADPVAITSVVSGAAVAIGVPFINAQLEGRRLERQSQDARLDELRRLLDDAVQHLWTAWTIFYEIDGEMREEASGPERLRSLGDKLTETTDVVVADALRIRLRTPLGAMISAKHAEAQKLVVGYESAYRRYLEDDADAADGRNERPRPSTVDLGTATERFIDASQEFVGVVRPRPAET